MNKVWTGLTVLSGCQEKDIKVKTERKSSPVSTKIKGMVNVLLKTTSGTT